MGEFGRDIVEIASLVVGLAVLATVLNNSQGAATVIQSATSGFSGLIGTATFQNSGNNSGLSF